MKSVTTTNPLHRKENMENKLALAGSAMLFFFLFFYRNCEMHIHGRETEEVFSGECQKAWTPFGRL